METLEVDAAPADELIGSVEGSALLPRTLSFTTIQGLIPGLKNVSEEALAV